MLPWPQNQTAKGIKIMRAGKVSINNKTTKHAMIDAVWDSTAFLD